jgi:GNAT superfamily N-acetyltransferase
MDAFEVERLEGPPPSTFDCGREEQNRHLHDQAWHNQQKRLSTTSLLMVHGIAAAFVTVCMDALPLSRQERGTAIPYRWVSSLKLAQLGVDRRFQGVGLGRWAVSMVVELAYEIGESVGCRYVTLDAQPDLEAWYAAQGFVRNELHQQQRKDDAALHHRDPERIPVSMRFDLGVKA